MNRPDLANDIQPDVCGKIMADARKWAWEQAVNQIGTNFGTEGKSESVEKIAVRLADFIQTGTFEAS